MCRSTIKPSPHPNLESSHVLIFINVAELYRKERLGEGKGSPGAGLERFRVGAGCVSQVALCWVRTLRVARP